MIRTARIPPAIALALAFVLLLALVVIAEIGQSSQRQINRLIGRSQRHQILLADLVRDLSAAESDQRGFLLTADSDAFARARAARERVASTLAGLTNVVREDEPLMTGEQRDALRRLQGLASTKLRELAASLALYSADGPQQAMNLVRSDSGSSPTMNQIRGDSATVSDAERAIVDAELARAERLRLVSGVLIGCVALLNVILLIVAATLLVRQARRRDQLTKQLARENEELERHVRQRTLELSALSSHLQKLSEKEKATLARELHDELGGLLIAVKMDVSWLHKRWPNPAADIQMRWARVLKGLDDGVDFKRRVVENLRPTLLDNMGVLPAVRWVTQETCSRAGLQYTEIYPEEDPSLSDDAAIIVFRLVQESLNNIVKHAHATHVRLQIAMHDQDMTVLIEDNGIGIESIQRDAVGSHGLATMRHRVRSTGGTLDIEPGAQGGTRVQAWLPLAGILKNPQIADPTESAGTDAATRSVSAQH